MKSVVQTDDMAVGKYIDRISESEVQVTEIARVIDGERKPYCPFSQCRTVLTSFRLARSETLHGR